MNPLILGTIEATAAFASLALLALLIMYVIKRKKFYKLWQEAIQLLQVQSDTRAPNIQKMIAQLTGAPDDKVKTMTHNILSLEKLFFTGLLKASLQQSPVDAKTLHDQFIKFSESHLAISPTPSYQEMLQERNQLTDTVKNLSSQLNNTFKIFAEHTGLKLEERSYTPDEMALLIQHMDWKHLRLKSIVTDRDEHPATAVASSKESETTAAGGVGDKVSEGVSAPEDTLTPEISKGETQESAAPVPEAPSAELPSKPAVEEPTVNADSPSVQKNNE